MPDAILCPQCEKRYTLPASPPATITCKQCGTLVDLSAFGGGQGPAAAAPSGGARARTSGSQQDRTQGGRGRRRTPPPRQPAARAPGEKQPPILAIIIVVLVVVVLVAVRSGGDDDAPKKKRLDPASSSEPGTAPGSASSNPSYETASTQEGTARKRRPSKRPKATQDGRLKLRLSRVTLKPLDWPEDVDDAIRQQTEASIRALYGGAREGREAEEWLLAQGRPIAGRLISEFVSIQRSPGIDNRDGTSMAMQIDALLHKIDGFIERACKERGQIKSTGFYAGQSFIIRTAKRWTWWWESGEWQTSPRDPWDPFEDESDETADGMKRPEPKKTDPKKGSGFGKRAGSG